MFYVSRFTFYGCIMVDLTEAKQKFGAILRATFFIVIIFILISLLYKSKEITFGVTLGGLLSLINLIVLGRLVESMFQQVRSIVIMTILGVTILMVLLFVVVYYVATHEVISLGAFAVGFSAFILGVFIDMVFPSKSLQQKE